MFIKTEVTLIYQGKQTADNGSPVNVEIGKLVRCDEMENFSNRYYTDQQRNMRASKNLVVPTYLTADIIQDGIRYELMYCDYMGLRYTVRNILRLKDTRQRMILDIQEIR